MKMKLVKVLGPKVGKCCVPLCHLPIHTQAYASITIVTSFITNQHHILGIQLSEINIYAQCYPIISQFLHVLKGDGRECEVTCSYNICMMYFYFY